MSSLEIEQAVLAYEKRAMDGDIEAQIELINAYADAEMYDDMARWCIIALDAVTPLITSALRSIPQMVVDICRLEGSEYKK